MVAETPALLRVYGECQLSVVDAARLPLQLLSKHVGAVPWRAEQCQDAVPCQRMLKHVDVFDANCMCFLVGMSHHEGSCTHTMSERFGC